MLLTAAADGVLGLELVKSASALLKEAGRGTADIGTGDADIDKLVAERTRAKKQKDYARADEIRTLLKEKGIILEDTPEGTTWKRQ